jgi:hypothetical protein
MRYLLAVVLSALPLMAGSATEIARAIRENSFDREECYRVRDLTLVKEDIRIYLTDGHLIFSKPVAGRRMAAVFTADVDGGDAEVILMPPDRAERRSLAAYIDSPNLDEHFVSALFLFTGDDYEKLKAQLPDNPANRKTPEIGPVMDETWTPALRNLGASFVSRLALDLLAGPGYQRGLLTGLFTGRKLGNFDVTFDPETPEQIVAGRVTTRNDRLYFDTWTSFVARGFRGRPAPGNLLLLRDARIQATVNPDLTLDAITRFKAKPAVDGLAVATFDISPEMEVSQVLVDGKPAEVLQKESLRLNLLRGGNNLFLVVPPEPFRAGQEYELEFHHSGKVIFNAGDRVFYVAARGAWYPMHGVQFVTYDMTFRYAPELDLVAAGELIDDHTEGEWRVTHRRTSAPIRFAAFNLGNYAHARIERNGYVVDVCANRALERALTPRPLPLVQAPVTPLSPRARRPEVTTPEQIAPPPPPSPLERLRTLAAEVASALEFMSARFGPPALPHLTVSPIPGTFGQGFPGLIYLSTLSYLKHQPGTRFSLAESQQIFYEDMLQAHETAHQWWGNRVYALNYRDYWLMEALANYSSMLFLEKSKGARTLDKILEGYRQELLVKGDSGATVESAGPIVLGPRLSGSQEPRAWRSITYGKGAWIIRMLHERMGNERFFSLLAELLKRYDGKEVTTEQFRLLAASFLPPKSDDPKLETFFDQWIYGTGIPDLKLTYTVKGKAPSLRLVGTLTQSEVDEDFSTAVPVEIQVARGKTVTQWVSSGSSPTSFTVALQQPPLKVSLDPRRAILRR